MDKGRLYCRTMGEGEPLLFVHGGPGLNQSYLLPAFNALTKKYMLIFYDQRSSGKSALSVKATMNFATFAADIDSIRSYFGLAKLNIIAHSWGCLTAITYAASYPGHTASLILLDPVPANSDFNTRMHERIVERTSSFDSLERSRILLTEAFKSGESEAIRQLMHLSFKINFCDTSYLDQLQIEIPDNYTVAALSYEGWKPVMNHYDLSAQLQAIRCPVIILYGACDIVPEEAVRQMQNLVPGSRLQLFAKSGHFCFIEQHRRCLRTIRRFLRFVPGL